MDMDLPGQYIHFFSYLKSILSGENDFFYTFSKTLGGDMTGLSAYYLLSPLNIIFCFFHESHFPAACTLLAAVKLGLCGLTMAIFLSYMNGSMRERNWVLLFSGSYALMSYNIVYFSNIMWMDAVYILPLVVLGIELLLRGKSRLLYILSLAYSLICNYYTGYMLCLFSVFYFAFRFCVLLIRRERGLGHILISYIFSSLLAGGLSAFVLLPTFLSLSGTKASLDTGKLAMFRAFPLSAFALKLFSNSVLNDLSLQNLPYIYTGVLTNALLALYFFNRGIRLSERIVCAVSLFILLISFDLNGSYVIWHGFSYPACFPFRNAFIMSFMMLYVAWQCFSHREALTWKSYIAAAVLTGIVVFMAKPFAYAELSRSSLLADIICTAVILLSLASGENFRFKRLSYILIASLQILLIFQNSIYLRTYASNGAVLDADEYAHEYMLSRQEMDFISDYDDSFYRVAGKAENQNEAMQLHYNSLSHFSSTDKSNVKDFVLRFGLQFFYDSWVAYGNGATATTDAFFSIKYIRDNISPQKDYPTIYDTNGGTIVQNPNALGIAMIADRAVLDEQLNNRNPFIRQNQAISAILGETAEIFTPVDELVVEHHNLAPPNAYLDGNVYFREDAEEEAAFVYHFTAASTDPVYMYSYAPLPGHIDLNLVAQLYVNGEHLCEYMGPYTWETVYLGCFEVGEDVEVVIKPEYDYFIMGNSYIYHEDMSLLADCAGTINERSGAQLERLSSSSLRWCGSIAEDGQLLMLTVPNERGWNLKVDGKSADISTAFGCLMAIHLEPGAHCVELDFIPYGLYAGFAVSFVSLLILIIWEIHSKKRKNKT